MRQTTIALAIFGLFGFAKAQDCQLQQTIRSTTEGIVTEIRNISTEVVPWGNGASKCMANLDGLVNGSWRKSFGEYTWYDQRPAKEMCAIAVGLAKKNLLQSVNSSIINSNSVVICRDNAKPKVNNTAVGMIVEDVTQLRPHPVFQKTFRYKDEQCRWFVEAGWIGNDFQKLNGIACLTSSRQWVVVDKF
jgi:hypothetical protein